MFLSVQNSRHLLLLWDSDTRLNSISEVMCITTSYLLAVMVTGPGVSINRCLSHALSRTDLYITCLID